MPLCSTYHPSYSHLPSPGNHRSAFCTLLSFSRVSNGVIWYVYFLCSGIFLSAFEIHPHCGVYPQFIIFLLSSIPLYRYNTLCFSVHLLIDIWVACSLWPLQVKLLWTFYFCILTVILLKCDLHKVICTYLRWTAQLYF